MRLEDLTVALRPRSAWEAVELGTALVRRHARAVWRPWLAGTLPAFALVNAACFAIDAPWLAMLLMWWLKPLFDRIPLYVLSRAVFVEVPGTRATLRGAFRVRIPPNLPPSAERLLRPLASSAARRCTFSKAAATWTSQTCCCRE